MSEFIAKHFDELTAHELQQIHIIRSLVFTVGQQSTDQEPDDADFECIHMVNEDESGKVLAYLRLFDLEKVQDAIFRAHGRSAAWQFTQMLAAPAWDVNFCTPPWSGFGTTQTRRKS